MTTMNTDYDNHDGRVWQQWPRPWTTTTTDGQRLRRSVAMNDRWWQQTMGSWPRRCVLHHLGLWYVFFSTFSYFYLLTKHVITILRYDNDDCDHKQRPRRTVAMNDGRWRRTTGSWPRRCELHRLGLWYVFFSTFSYFYLLTKRVIATIRHDNDDSDHEQRPWRPVAMNDGRWRRTTGSWPRRCNSHCLGFWYVF